MDKNKRNGILLSYLLIIVDILISIFIVPFFLKFFGDSEYGMYKLLLSTASYFSILDFGLGSTITRFVIKYKTESNKEKEENFVAMSFVLYGALALILIVSAVGLSFLLPFIYKASIDPAQFIQAKIMFLLMCGSTAVSLFNHAYNGLLSAYERFVFIKGSNLAKILIRITLIVIFGMLTKSIVLVCVIDFILNVLLLLINVAYNKLRSKIRIKLRFWDKPVAKEMLIFTSAILVQTIINQFNSNVDNIVLGVYTTTSIVASYSIALQIYTMYSTFSSVIASIYLPSISKDVFANKTKTEITEKLIEPSRIQLGLLLMIFVAFLLFGKDFISIWVGDGKEIIYYIACILLASSIIDLSQNTIDSVLKARNKLKGKTIILALSTLVNVVLTFSLVPVLKEYGAVIGTSVSLIFGYGLSLNIYYHKTGMIDVGLFFKNVFNRLWLVPILTFCIFLPFSILFDFTNLVHFLLICFTYVVVYLIFIFIIGMTKFEKKKLIDTFKRRRKNE